MSERLVLASASPQRKEILSSLGVKFEVIVNDYDESICTETDPATRAQILAHAKASDVAAQQPDAWVLGCDTLVVASDGTLLEKPIDAEDVKRMLKLHSGSCSTVHSAICLLSPSGEKFAALNSSKVYFRELTEEDIDWWVGTTLWLNRSGSFQIDGLGQLMIEKIEGEFAAIVGFPVFDFGKLCKQAGVQFV